MENRLSRHIRRCRLIFAVFLVILNISLVVLFFLEFQFFIDLFSEITTWIISNYDTGILILTGSYILAIALMIPTSLFLFAMGIVFNELLGLVPGYLFSLFIGTLSTIAGSSLAFFLARHLLRSTLLSYIKHDNYRARAILLALKNNGFKLVTLFRLAPIFPFSILNYALGASSVSYKNYVLGSIGFIPKLALYFYISVSVGSIKDAVDKEEDNLVEVIVLISLGAFFSIASGIYVTVLAKREMNRILDETETTIIAESESLNMDAPILED